MVNYACLIAKERGAATVLALLHPKKLFVFHLLSFGPAEAHS